MLLARHFLMQWHFLITDASPANQQWWWWYHVIYGVVDHHIQIYFYSTYFPGLGFSPSSAVSRLGCRVILLFISTAKPVSTLRWIANRTGFFFLPSSENYNKGKGRWENKSNAWHYDRPFHPTVFWVVLWSWSNEYLDSVLTWSPVRRTSTHAYDLLWAIVYLWSGANCLHDTDMKPDFIPSKEYLHSLNCSEPLQVSVFTQTQPTQVSAWTSTCMSWSELEHCQATCICH